MVESNFRPIVHMLGKRTSLFTPPSPGTVDCLCFVSSLELDSFIVFPIHVLTLLIPTIIRASAAKCLAACRKLGTIYVFGVKPNVFALYTAGLAGRKSQEHLDVPPHLLSCLATIQYCRSKAGSRPGKVQSYPDAHTHSTLLQRYLDTNESCVSHRFYPRSGIRTHLEMMKDKVTTASRIKCMIEMVLKVTLRYFDESRLYIAVVTLRVK